MACPASFPGLGVLLAGIAATVVATHGATGPTVLTGPPRGPPATPGTPSTLALDNGIVR